MFDIHLNLFVSEIALILLTLGLLVLDISLKDNAKRGLVQASVAFIGVTLILAQLLFRWGHFGTALNTTYIHDGVSYFFKLLFLLGGALTIYMVRQYQAQIKRGHGEFTLLVLFSLIGMMFLASANDFLLFFVSLEILTVSLYIMTSYLRDKNPSIEAGVKYLILGALSTAIFLYGLSFIYGATGSTSYAQIQAKLNAMPSVPTSFIFGMILVISSLAFKIAAVPFHFWAPDIYEGAPTPVTAFLSIGSKVAGFAAFTRLLMTVFPAASNNLILLFSVLSALTILYGNLGAIPQTNIKRLLGYSSIGHSGYLLIGLATFFHTGKEAVLYYLLAYIFSAGGAFLVLIALSNHCKNDEISELAGLSKKSPLLAAGMLIALLSLAGVPPLAGFFAKFYLLLAGVESGLYWLVIIGVLNVITSLYYYLKIVQVMYMDAPKDNRPISLSWDQKAMQYFAIFGIVFLGIFQNPVVELAKQAFLNAK